MRYDCLQKPDQLVSLPEASTIIEAWCTYGLKGIVCELGGLSFSWSEPGRDDLVPLALDDDIGDLFLTIRTDGLPRYEREMHVLPSQQ